MSEWTPERTENLRKAILDYQNRHRLVRAQEMLDAVAEIERLQNELEILQRASKTMTELFDLQVACADKLQSELAAEREAHRWIPVEKELQKDCEEVLTLSLFGEIRTGYHLKDIKQWSIGNFYYYGDTYSEITHWQPLPEAPKD